MSRPEKRIKKKMRERLRETRFRMGNGTGVSLEEWADEPLEVLEVLPPDPDAAVKLAVNRLGDDVAGLRPWTFIDQKGSGQDGGAFQNNQWLQRDLNSSVGNPDTADVQLANNQITLAEGAWAWDVEAPAYRCERHQARIFNLTSQQPVLWGTSELSDASKNRSQTRSRIRGEVTVGEAGATFEIQHRCTYYHSSSTDQGFGVALNHGEPNVFTTASIVRVD